MITEFTCGVYTATFNSIGCPKWFLKANEHVIAIIEENGLLKFTSLMLFTHADLIEIAVLMNNIKRQYKQLYNENNQLHT